MEFFEGPKSSGRLRPDGGGRGTLRFGEGQQEEALGLGRKNRMG